MKEQIQEMIDQFTEDSKKVLEEKKEEAFELENLKNTHVNFDLNFDVPQDKSYSDLNISNKSEEIPAINFSEYESVRLDHKEFELDVVKSDNKEFSFEMLSEVNKEFDFGTDNISLNDQIEIKNVDEIKLEAIKSDFNDNDTVMDNINIPSYENEMTFDNHSFENKKDENLTFDKFDRGESPNLDLKSEFGNNENLNLYFDTKNINEYKELNLKIEPTNFENSKIENQNYEEHNLANLKLTLPDLNLKSDSSLIPSNLSEFINNKDNEILRVEIVKSVPINII